MLSIPQLSPKMTEAKTGKPSAVALTAIDYQTRGSWGRDGTTASGDFGRDASQQRSPVQVDVRNLNSQPTESEATFFSRAVVHRQRYHGLPLVSA